MMISNEVKAKYAGKVTFNSEDLLKNGEAVTYGARSDGSLDVFEFMTGTGIITDSDVEVTVYLFGNEITIGQSIEIVLSVYGLGCSSYEGSGTSIKLEDDGPRKFSNISIIFTPDIGVKIVID